MSISPEERLSNTLLEAMRSANKDDFDSSDLRNYTESIGGRPE